MFAGFHSTAHKHPDDLSFELYGFGGDYIVETGRYAYVSSPERSKAMSTEAHNVVQVEDKEFSLNQSNVGKSKINKVTIRKDGIMEASGYHNLIPGVTHERKVFYDQQKTFLIVDTLKSSYFQNYIQRFHLAPKFNLEKIDVRNTVATHPSGRTLTVMQLYAPSLITGEKGNSYVSYRDYEWVNRHQLMYKQSGRNVRFMTLLHLGESPEDIATYAKVFREGDNYIVKYKTKESKDYKEIQFPAEW